MNSITCLTPFPDLSFAVPWTWPAPPFLWPCESLQDDPAGETCRLTLKDGSVHDGVLVDGRSEAAGLCLAISYRGRVVDVAASTLLQVDMRSPLVARAEAPGIKGAPLPMVHEARQFTLIRRAGMDPLAGVTLGHVDTADGIYLFPPGADDWSLLRIFVPRHACIDLTFGHTAREAASVHWIRDADQLRQALHEGKKKDVILVGQALIDTAMLTRTQLERAIAGVTDGRPVGETAVAMGAISNADLQTALAYKMGRLFVDLASFPANASALRAVPARVAIGCCALPLMFVGDDLVVAVDKPVRAQTLEQLGVVGGHRIRAVLARRKDIIHALQDRYGDEFKRDASLSKHFAATGF
jgi:hypothetical protein